MQAVERRPHVIIWACNPRLALVPIAAQVQEGLDRVLANVQDSPIRRDS